MCSVGLQGFSLFRQMFLVGVVELVIICGSICDPWCILESALEDSDRASCGETTSTVELTKWFVRQVSRDRRCDMWHGFLCGLWFTSRLRRSGCVVWSDELMAILVLLLLWLLPISTVILVNELENTGFWVRQSHCMTVDGGLFTVSDPCRVRISSLWLTFMWWCMACELRSSVGVLFVWQSWVLEARRFAPTKWYLTWLAKSRKLQVRLMVHQMEYQSATFRYVTNSREELVWMENRKHQCPKIRNSGNSMRQYI